MLVVLTSLFYVLIYNYLDSSAWISLQTLFKDVESLLHLVNFKYVSDTCMILSHARSLIE